MLQEITRICNWNSARYDQQYAHALTIALLQEELDELAGATDAVDKLDALIDLTYVAIGAMWKLGLSPTQIAQAINIVCDSNDSKSVAKTDPNVKANIDKGANYFRPEPELAKILAEAYSQKAIAAATESKCRKRKVGAVIVKDGCIISSGCNHHPAGEPCEDSANTTVDAVVHAEVAALQTFADLTDATMYVTHPPCDDCASAIEKAKLKEVIIVDEFMKFDTDKLRYDLVPPEATKALAEVLTYGAKKYKPNNWKQGTPDRYVAALYRHLEAWRSGEMHDSESGLSHLSHALTNVAFLIHFQSK